jgi:DNA-binding CsgD family transcriptional regulator
VAYYAQGADPKARRVSDVIDQAAWVETDFYRQCLQRLQFLHWVALPLEINESTVVALSFARRDPDFTERDCELLDAFAPHFRLAWERHENPWAGQRQLTAQRRFQALGLSPRESEVLYWMTEGKQNPEIAAILGIRLGTVQEYVADILKKLGQENRHAATVFALQRLRPR